MHLGLLASLREENRKRDGEGEMRCYGWGLGVREAGKTRPDSLSLSDPCLSLSVGVYVQLSVPSPPQLDNGESPVPDWGQLVAAEGRGGGGGGGGEGVDGRYQTPLSDLCVWTGTERDQKSDSPLNG